MKSALTKAVKCNASTDNITFSNDLPSVQSVTFTGWFYVDIDRAGNYRYLFSYDNSGGTSWIVFGWANANQFEIGSNNETTGYFSAPNYPSINRWYFGALVSQGSGATDLIGYLFDETGLIERKIGEGPSAGADTIGLLNNSFSEWVDGRLQNVGIWNRPLGDAEIRKVWEQGPLEVSKGLWRYLPFNGDTFDPLRSVDVDSKAGLAFVQGKRFKSRLNFAFADLPDNVRFATIKKPWTEQPPAGTPIDWSNPLTKGLATVVSGNTNIGAARDIVTGKPDYLLNASGGGSVDPEIIGTDKGQALSNRPDSQYFWQHNSVHPGNQLYSSCLVLFRVGTYAPSGAMLFGSGETASSSAHRFGIKSYSSSIQAMCNTSGGGYQAAAWVTSQPTETWILAIGTFNSQSQELELYVDGINRASQTLIDTSGINSTGTYEYKILNGNIADPNREIAGDVALAMAWHGRALTAPEVASLSENPWQIFEPQEVMVPFNEALPELVTWEEEW